ncbi:MAG: response regulator [Brevundimonas sp.]|jgi:CheY-like chemotaxis protein|nr:response regulator [Brevundimonas sp.]
MSAELVGRRILLLEDKSRVAMLIESIVEDLDGATVGPLASVEEAFAFLATSPAVGAALLAVNLAGRQVFPVAEALTASGVPVVFSTGYGERGRPRTWRGRPNARKPFTEASLRDAPRQVPALPEG